MKPNGNKFQVIIADDHEIFLIGLRSVIKAQSEYEISGEATSPSRLATLLSHSSCDVLITDFSMPGDRFEDGLGMLQRIRKQRPELAIVVLTMLDNPVLLSAILGLGVMAVMPKSGLSATIPQALMKVSLGQRYLAQEIHGLLSKANLARGTTLTLFSMNEIAIFQSLVKRQSLENIATDLSYSRDKVVTTIDSTLDRLKIGTTAQLVDYLMDAGFTK